MRVQPAAPGENLQTYSLRVSARYERDFQETAAVISAGGLQPVATKGDASPTLTAMVDAPVQRFTAPLTAARTVTLATAGAVDGATFRIVRTAAATGAFNLSVGALKTLTAAGQWCDVVFDGSAWTLSAAGSL